MMFQHCRHAWNPVPNSVSRGWGVVMGCLIMGSVLIGACSSSGTRPVLSPTPATISPALIPLDHPSTPWITPTGTVRRPPVKREVIADVPVEAVFLPGQVRELYVFSTDRARRIGVLLEAVDSSGPLQLQVRLYDAGGGVVPKTGSEDDQPSLRGKWDLPGPGTYTVQVFGPETQSRAFTLTVISLASPQPGGGPMAYGESRSGEIAVRGQRDQWTFQGQQGDHVVITLTAPGMDSYLMLYDPSGELVVQNDDDPTGGMNAGLDVVLPADGEYLIVVRMYADNQTGTYRLSLVRVLE
jgi:hypothetical protein